MSLEQGAKERLIAVLRTHHYSLASLEWYAIDVALERNEGCITKTAIELGIGRTTLHRRLRAREEGQCLGQ